MIVRMVLAVVDDLLFSSKIRAAAGRVAQPITFVRQPAAALEAARAHRPQMVVVDLDRDALDPLGVIEALRRELGLETTRIVGYVSHVHTDRIRAAQRAGAEVLARSAFVALLARDDWAAAATS